MSPPGGTGAASIPGAMPGAAAKGANLLRGGLKMILEALPLLPMGSEEQQAAMKAASDLSKHVGHVAGAGDPAATIQQLAAAARGAAQQPVPPALAGGGGGAGGPPPIPPTSQPSMAA
jgi:hypothetical protein